ncbi:MAG: DUF4296 domain-containing protein, partial [Bacteroidota bacterium]
MRYLWMILLTMFLWSCQENTIPDDLIGRDQMKTILLELHLADAVAERDENQPARRTVMREAMYDAVMKRFQLDRETFMRSYEYYLHQESVEMDEIYREITDTLNAQM